MTMEALVTIRPELLSLSREAQLALLPLLWILGAGAVAIFLGMIRAVSARWLVFYASIAMAIGGVVSVLGLIGNEPVVIFNGMMVLDRFSHFFSLIFIGSAILTFLASFRYLDRAKIHHPEYYILMFFSVAGMMLLVSALDLIVLFIGLELMSLSIYALVGFRRSDRKCNEAAVKYFILGSAASAVFLYGSALLYGATGSLNIRAMLDLLKTNPAVMTPLFAMGLGLVVIGFLFKVAAVPFHMWMPDVYEGAPTPVTGFMTSGLKAAAFGAFIRVLANMGYGASWSATLQNHMHDILWISAVLTMVIGNLIALAQTNLKRLLGYSSIAHTGYLLVGLMVGGTGKEGFAPVLLYLVVYAAMNLGAFVVLAILSSQEDGGVNLHDFKGLSRRHPWLSFAMAIFLFSLAGVPPLGGFVAKYLIFYSAVQANEIPLVIIGVLCSVISVYYYLRVLVFMYMRESEEGVASSRVTVGAALAVATMAVVVLQIGVLPSRVVEATKRAVSSL